MIYKIELNKNNIYIGSTTQLLCKRQSCHNSDLKKKPHLKLYKSCIENNITNIKCIWIADVEYSSNAELRMIEEKYRKELNGNLNSKKCYISEEEKKIYMKEYNDKFYENNKDTINKQQKEYRENNKDKMKEYRENNKKKIKEYYEENKDKINKKIKCDKCGCTINKPSLKKHQQSNKCKLMSECIFSDSD